MSGCDFCTADRCQQIEDRLTQLEEAFEQHISQPIPDAHKNEPNISITSNIVDNVLTTNLTIDSNSDSTSVSLPEGVINNLEIDATTNNDQLTINVLVNDKTASTTERLPSITDLSIDSKIEDNILKLFLNVDGFEDNTSVNLRDIKPSVTFDIFELQNGDFLFKVGVNGESDEDTLYLSNLGLFDTNLKGSASFQNDILTITIADGKSQDTFEVTIPISQLSNSFESNLKISGLFQYEQLIITVADGNSQDTTSIHIPINNRFSGGGGQSEDEPSNLVGTATFESDILTISIADGQSATAFQVKIPLMDEELIKKIEKMYEILGGDTWQETSQGTLTLEVKPEDLIKEVGTALYREDSNTLNPLSITNLLELLTVFSTVDFYRSGHHRLPASVVPTLVNVVQDEDSDQPVQTQIYDCFSFQEWMIKQLDGLIGEFPLKIKSKKANATSDGVEETELVLPNISEAIAEFMALSLATSQDADLAVNIGMKSLVEARNAANAAITAVDYAQANAQYLGYKGNQTKRDVPLSFTPGASSLAASLQPSTKSIVGWKNEDNETLIEIIKKTLISAEIIKAALFHPYQPGGNVAGDAVVDSINEQREAEDQTWEEFKNRVNNPAGRYQVPKPKAKIKDLTVDDNP